ncbi:MAG: cytosine deaminase, partial [Oscillospiraceae bacterium]|nr:cytosine deaminase [Oscillospiraceae bacterium]
MKDEYSFISSKKSYIVQNNGRPASFIVLDADNWYNALNRNAAVLR